MIWICPVCFVFRMTQNTTAQNQAQAFVHIYLQAGLTLRECVLFSTCEQFGNSICFLGERDLRSRQILPDSVHSTKEAFLQNRQTNMKFLKKHTAYAMTPTGSIAFTSHKKAVLYAAACREKGITVKVGKFKKEPITNKLT